MRRLRKIISEVIYIAVLLIVIRILFVRFAGYNLYIIETGSMEPDYPVNSVVFVKECDRDTLTAGDVVTFSREGVIVTHRIVSVNGDGTLTTKGDANKTNDIRPVNKSNVIGRVEKCVKGLGPFVIFLSDIYGKIFIVCLVLISMIIDPGQKGGKKKNENKV